MINVPLSTAFDLDNSSLLKDAVKSAETKLADAGRVLLRASGTEPSQLESDEVPAEMAKALCRHLQAQLPSGELSWPLYVRIIRHLGSDDPEVVDDSTGNVEVLYEADVWRAEGDAPPSFHVLKRVPNSQSAPPIRRESKS